MAHVHQAARELERLPLGSAVVQCSDVEGDPHPRESPVRCARRAPSLSLHFDWASMRCRCMRSSTIIIQSMGRTWPAGEREDSGWTQWLEGRGREGTRRSRRAPACPVPHGAPGHLWPIAQARPLDDRCDAQPGLSGCGCALEPSPPTRIVVGEDGGEGARHPHCPETAFEPSFRRLACCHHARLAGAPQDFPLLALTRNRCPARVVHLHGSMANRLAGSGNLLMKACSRLLLRQCDAILVLSEQERRDWLRSAPSARVEVVVNPFVPPARMPAPTNAGTPTLLFVGRLIPEKGVFDLLEALRLVDGSDRAHCASRARDRSRRNCVRVSRGWVCRIASTSWGTSPAMHYGVCTCPRQPWCCLPTLAKDSRRSSARR